MKNIEEGLNHKDLQVNTLKYLSGCRKRRYELVKEAKKHPNRIFIQKELAAKVIMDCRTTATHKFRTRSGLKQYDVIFLTKEQSVLNNKS